MPSGASVAMATVTAASLVTSVLPDVRSLTVNAVIVAPGAPWYS